MSRARLAWLYRLLPAPMRPGSERGRAVALTSLAMVAAKAVSLLTVLISVPLTLDYLGPERYGIWIAISSVTALLGVADLGMGFGLMNLVAQATGERDADAQRRYMASGMLVLALAAALVGLGFALLYPQLAWDRLLNVHDPARAAEAGRAIAVFALCFLGGVAASSILRIQMGLQKGFIANLWQAAGSVAGLGATLVAIQCRADLPWLVLAQSGTPLLMTVLNGVWFFSRSPLRPRLADISWLAMSRIAVSGAGFFVLQFDALVAYTSDNIIVAHQLGPLATTEFSVPARLFSVIGIVVSTLLAPLWPAYAEARAAGDHRWIRATLLRSLGFAALGGVAAAAVLLICGRTLIQLWVGARVHPGAGLMLALACWSVLECVGVALSMFLNGMGVVRPQLWIATVFAGTVLLVKLELVRRLGLIGVPVATSVVYLLTTLLPYAVIIPTMAAITGQPATRPAGDRR